MKSKFIKAKAILEELYLLNNENAEIVEELLNDEDFCDKWGEELESLKENIEKMHNLL